MSARARAEMEAFDNLAPEIRAALNQAVIGTGVIHYAQLATRTPPSVVVSILRKADARVMEAYRAALPPVRQ